MSAIRCHFDGHVIVPDQPVDLPVNKPMIVHFDPSEMLADSDTGEIMTGAKLAASESIGMWSDRDDITDSTEFANELRRKVERRGTNE